MKEVDASEAEVSFDALLDLVGRGETVAINRNGKVVAHLIPSMEPAKVVDPEGARAAMERIRSRANQRDAAWPIRLGGWKAYRDEGRR